MQRIVVDASVIVKWLSSHNEQWLDKVDLLMQRASKGRLQLVAPTIALYETANAVRYKSLSGPEKIECIDRLYELPIKYYDISNIGAKIALVIAQDGDITYYDAVYGELAERLNTELITANPKHHKKMNRVEVIALQDYK